MKKNNSPITEMTDTVVILAGDKLILSLQEIFHHNNWRKIIYATLILYPLIRQLSQLNNNFHQVSLHVKSNFYSIKK